MATKKKSSSTPKRVIKKDIEEEKITETIEKDDEPSWYHYVIILLVLLGILVGAYFAFEIFDSKSQGNINESFGQYIYEHRVGDITYNIHFLFPISELKKQSYPIELNERDIFSTTDMTFSFQEYNGTDNGEISVSAIKLRRFLGTVYSFDFGEGNFAQFNETNCSVSSNDSRIVTFDPYSENAGVFVDNQTGCVTFETTSPQEMRILVDYFIYETIREDNGN